MFVATGVNNAREKQIMGHAQDRATPLQWDPPVNIGCTSEMSQTRRWLPAEINDHVLKRSMIFLW